MVIILNLYLNSIRNKMAFNVSYSDHLGIGPYPGEFIGGYGRNQFSRSVSLGRSAPLGRRESDRFIEEKYGLGYPGKKFNISDFFRWKTWNK